jgi:sortase A
VFPGVNGNIFLFAHSTDSFWNVGRYNAVFYLLKDLENGDEINVYYLGVRHIYHVVNKLIINPTDVHYMTDTLPYEQLSLQTCWPPGTTLKRMLVIARPESALNRQ